MTALRPLFDHVNAKRRAGYEPVGDDGRGLSPLINRTLVSSSLRSSKPAKSPTLVLETATSALRD